MYGVPRRMCYVRVTYVRRMKCTRACADPEIFMRGGPTKMVIFGHRRGGSNPPKIPKLPFLGKIFKFQGVGSGRPVPRPPPPPHPPTHSGSVHGVTYLRRMYYVPFLSVVYLFCTMLFNTYENKWLCSLSSCNLHIT